MKKGFTFLPLLLLLIPLHTVESQTNLTLFSEAGRQAYQTLLTAPQFEDNAIGFAAAPSKLVAAFRVLLQEPNGDSAFKTLLARATPAGQLYALCGLYFTDHQTFLTEVEKHKLRTDYVRTQFGCIGMQFRVSHLIEVKSPNAVRLKTIDQSIDEWRKEHPEITGGFQLDIIGGGYPHKFLPIHRDGNVD